MSEHSTPGQPADDQPVGQNTEPQPTWQPPAPDRHLTYGQPSYYGQAGYDQTAYGQAAYGQTAHDQTAHDQTAYGQPAGYASAPSEQPYFVPTAHQQAWSTAQQHAGQQQYPGQLHAGQHYSGQQYPGQYAGQQFWPTPPVPARPRSRRLLLGSIAAATATALAAGGIAVAVDRSNNGSSQQTALNSPTGQNPFGQNGAGGQAPYGNGFGGGLPGSGTGGGIPVPGTGSGPQTTGPATAAQQVGVVNITTTLNYGEGKAAGTGIVLTSNGEILTNNHVIDGSTAITVTVVTTGKSYSATVVGTDPTDDVSVLQLKDASGLTTAKLGDSGKVAVGDAVTAVGNAGGTGGTPTAAPGTVTALNQSLTASDANGSNAERLTGMIEVNAAIEAGDSGGPLYDNATGSVIGIDTAASSARFAGAATTGYAIPIAKAVSIADQIESGKASSTVHIGYPAFLGVQLSPAGQSGGAAIGGVVSGSAAAKAGLQAGDTITGVDGDTITSASGLSSVMSNHKPGDQVRLRYTDASGQTHSVTVTLGSGPAD